ncbi:MAG: hypothetical protein LBC89_01820 [Bacteroidales bacterium]|jgi:glycerol-3-phosphate dehydrogenase (NAD(P)+)|nr:hypothetical protein [Bacteroidales bacterium]
MKTVVLGAGTFGTALANSVHQDLDVILYTVEFDVVEDINQNRRNSKYFPNKKLSKNIRATTQFVDIADSDMAFIAIPSGAVVDFFTQKKFSNNTIIINGSKGFAKENLLICQFLENLLPKNPICAIKGPSFASEMIFDIPTSFTIAAKNENTYKKITEILRNDLVVTDWSTDILGVEYVSVVKNVYAIVMGIVDAYYNSPNVRFLVFTKILREIRTLMDKMNINKSILYHYCGIGDLGLTSLNDLSRNRTLGLLIGKGFFDPSYQNNGVLIEGLRALNEISSKIQGSSKEFPIIYNASLLLHNQIKVKAFINKIIFG